MVFNIYNKKNVFWDPNQHIRMCHKEIWIIKYLLSFINLLCVYMYFFLLLYYLFVYLLILQDNQILTRMQPVHEFQAFGEPMHTFSNVLLFRQQCSSLHIWGNILFWKKSIFKNSVLTVCVLNNSPDTTTAVWCDKVAASWETFDVWCTIIWNRTLDQSDFTVRIATHCNSAKIEIRRSTKCPIASHDHSHCWCRQNVYMSKINIEEICIYLGVRIL